MHKKSKIYLYSAVNYGVNRALREGAMFDKITQQVMGWYRQHDMAVISVCFKMGTVAGIAIGIALLTKIIGLSGFWTALKVALPLATLGVGAYYLVKWRRAHPPTPNRRRRMARAPAPEPVPVKEPPYIPYEQIHPITKQFSGLSSDELHEVYVDDAHHWVVTLAMVHNPFWGRDNDVQPDMSAALRAKLSSKMDERLVRWLRRIIRVARYTYYLMLGSGFLILLLIKMGSGLQHLLPQWLPWVLLLVPLGLTVPWVWYIQRIAQGCRIVMTKRQIRLVVHQLPWRTNTSTPVSQTVFNTAVIEQSLLGKILRFSDVLIRTKEQEEPLPAWIRAKNIARIKAVLSYWEWLKYDKERLSYEQRPERTTPEVAAETEFKPSPDDTQAIPVQPRKE